MPKLLENKITYNYIRPHSHSRTWASISRKAWVKRRTLYEMRCSFISSDNIDLLQLSVDRRRLRNVFYFITSQYTIFRLFLAHHNVGRRFKSKLWTGPTHPRQSHTDNKRRTHALCGVAVDLVFLTCSHSPKIYLGCPRYWVHGKPSRTFPWKITLSDHILSSCGHLSETHVWGWNIK